MNIQEKIKEIYNSEKGRGFITHLIRSFLPIHKSNFVTSKPNNDKDFVCAITGVKLLSQDEKMQILFDVRESAVDYMFKKMKAQANNEKFTEVHPSEKLVNGRVLGICCDSSDKFLCKEALQSLLDFALSESLKGNSHISYVLKDMQQKEQVAYLEEKGVIKDSKESKAIKKATLQPNKVTFADLEILQQLKNKMMQ